MPLIIKAIESTLDTIVSDAIGDLTPFTAISLQIR
jgi:hypothetical protein